MNPHPLLPSTPFPRWPLSVHGVLALAMVGACGWGSHAVLHEQRQAVALAEQRLAAMRLEAQKGEAARVVASAPDFTATLPRAAVQDALGRDVVRFALANGVELQSVTTQTQARTAQSLGWVRFGVEGRGSYKGVKAWLAEVLARYPSVALAVKT